MPPSGKTPPGGHAAAATTVKGGKPIAGKGRPATAPSPPKQAMEVESDGMSAEQHDEQRPATAQRMQSKIEKKQGQFQLALDDDLMDALRLPDLLSSELPNDFDLPDLPPRTSVSFLKSFSIKLIFYFFQYSNRINSSFVFSSIV